MPKTSTIKPMIGTKKPIVGTNRARGGVANALFGKTLQRVLALLFGHPGRGFYLREILAHVGSGSSQVQLELARLTEAGLLLREPRANQVWYRANPEASIFEELRAIARKTFGVAEPLRELLAPIGDRIEFAFVFGSTARGEDTAGSDVDLLVAGEVSMQDLAEPLERAEAILKRPVSPILMTVDEIARKRAGKHHFLETVIEGPKLYVVGSQETFDDILRRPASKSRRKVAGTPR